MAYKAISECFIGLSFVEFKAAENCESNKQCELPFMMIKAMIQIDNYESWFVVGFVLFFNFIFHEVFDIFFIFDVDDLIVFAFPIDL